MNDASFHRWEPALSFALLLLLTLTGCYLVQWLGWLGQVPLLPHAFNLSVIISLVITYGRFFKMRKSMAIYALVAFTLLTILGFAYHSLPDMSWDGNAYHMPAVSELSRQWNPLRSEAELLWMNIFPWGAWAMEAALSVQNFSLDAGKILHVWWLFIAIPVLLAGIKAVKHAPSSNDYQLGTLMALSPVLATQLLTFYIDGSLYLAGLTFLGAGCLYVHASQTRRLAGVIMGCCLIFIINAKLSGLYHATLLCAAICAMAWLREHRLPWKLAALLLAVGLFSTLAVGYRPYVTNLQEYGSLLHRDSAEFIAPQRPANLDDKLPPMRFVYSLFSETGGAPRADMVLKSPLLIHENEWRAAGSPDVRAAGFGPLFALGFLTASIGAGWWVLRRKRSPVWKPEAAEGAKSLLCLTLFLLLASMFFPEGWWLRYVPFAYAVPFLMLLALPDDTAWLRQLKTMFLMIAFFNLAFVTFSSWDNYQEQRESFKQAVIRANGEPLYLVPDKANFATRNHAYKLLRLRLHQQGLTATLAPDRVCMRLIWEQAGVKVCSPCWESKKGKASRSQRQKAASPCAVQAPG